MPDAQGIQVSVNGQAVSAPTGCTLAELLRRLALDGRPVAVEHNRRVVPRAEHASVRLNHGDTLEIVTFVGGG
jgi:thiamine biosynthesis protein ThiS